MGRSLLALLGPALALAVASGAHAQASSLDELGSDAPSSAGRGAFLQTELGGGYWHYWQAHWADREADGFVSELRGSFAWALGEEVALGTTFSLQFYYGGGTRLTDGTTFGPDPAPGGSWGLLLAWMPAGEQPPVSLSLSGGIAGAGMHHWGGFGPYVAPALTIFFAHHGRSHFGLTVRLQYEPMFSADATPNGAEKNFFSGSLALGWTLF